MANASSLKKVSSAVGTFRFAFMPLGLFALVAVGVHAAADLVDDRFLSLVQWLDGHADALFGSWSWTASWVDAIGSREQTLIARTVTLVWELAADLFIAFPALGYDEEEQPERRFAMFQKETWKTLFQRLNREPAPMRLVRPLVTAVFVLGGAFAVSRLVESTLFVGLQGGVAPADVAEPIARALGGLALGVVLFSFGGRAVLRALQYADASCQQMTKLGKKPWLVGLWGNLVSLPLALALALEARVFLSLFL